jgi:hypothetical protein
VTASAKCFAGSGMRNARSKAVLERRVAARRSRSDSFGKQRERDCNPVTVSARTSSVTSLSRGPIRREFRDEL